MVTCSGPIILDSKESCLVDASDEKDLYVLCTLCVYTSPLLNVTSYCCSSTRMFVNYLASIHANHSTIYDTINIECEGSAIDRVNDIPVNMQNNTRLPTMTAHNSLRYIQ